MMDSRIAQRRQLVLEEDARLRLKWIVMFFFIVTAAGLLISLVRSPWLDIDEVRVSGVRNADVQAALTTADVSLGTPTLAVDAESLAAALETDPWVARAEVAVVWPNTVDINVLEHQSIGWVETKNGWMRVSAAGTVIARGAAPPAAAAHIKINGDVAGKVGEEMTSRPATAAVDFLANLPSDLRRRARVWGNESRLVANVRGTRIELGTSSQMLEKAAAVAGIISQEDIPKGSVINVVAPTRPAVSNPQAQVEAQTSTRPAASTSG